MTERCEEMDDMKGGKAEMVKRCKRMRKKELIKNCSKKYESENGRRKKKVNPIPDGYINVRGWAAQVAYDILATIRKEGGRILIQQRL
jgi:hypothetical protein